MMLPLAGYRDLDDAVLLGSQGEINAGTFFARARELAEALPEAPFVINLSESRLGFMLGFAAALVRRQTSLLPSGQGRGDWEQLMQHYPGASIVSDRAIDATLAFDLRPFLAMDGPPQSPFDLPRIPNDFAAAILFTSGSTGQPTAHAKSWGQLWRGAASLSIALAWKLPVRCAVVGSVPPQHMFGLESTVMLPWYAGIPVHVHKPLLPADIEVALAQCARPCWWMTTPVHLRPPLQAASELGELAGIVSSTMSLPSVLATAAETRWQVPVLEVYGSTETGALATRRTAADDLWTPLRGVTLQQEKDGDATRIRAAGSHIDVSVLLADKLRINTDGRFQWLGRSEDILKVGGKRASLSALNHRITEIPGVDDAVYFAPDAAGDAASHDETHPSRRLVAFYVSSTLSCEQVRAALRLCIDPVFMPRPLFQVPFLPRNANGKLPHAALAALYSQFRGLGDGGGRSDSPTVPPVMVPANHPAIPGHFPGNPIVPGVVILSLVIDAIRREFPGVVLGTLFTMRFHAPLTPDQPFTVKTLMRGERIYVEVREETEDGATGTLTASGQWSCGAGTRAKELV